jgi:hypothetical protein
MATVIYETPNSVKEMFEQGENSYRIIDYSYRKWITSKVCNISLMHRSNTDNMIQRWNAVVIISRF